MLSLDESVVVESLVVVSELLDEVVEAVEVGAGAGCFVVGRCVGFWVALGRGRQAGMTGRANLGITSHHPGGGFREETSARQKIANARKIKVSFDIFKLLLIFEKFILSFCKFSGFSIFFYF